MLAQKIPEDLILTILSVREIHMATSRQHCMGVGMEWYGHARMQPKVYGTKTSELLCAQLPKML